MTLDRDTFYIDGEWAAPASGQTLQVVSPHSEEVVATVPEGTVADIDAAVAAARRAFDEGPWPRLSPQERIDVVQAFSGLYAGKLAEIFRYQAEHAFVNEQRDVYDRAAAELAWERMLTFWSQHLRN